MGGQGLERPPGLQPQNWHPMLDLPESTQWETDATLGIQISLLDVAGLRGTTRNPESCASLHALAVHLEYRWDMASGDSGFPDLSGGRGGEAGLPLFFPLSLSFLS